MTTLWFTAYGRPEREVTRIEHGAEVTRTVIDGPESIITMHGLHLGDLHFADAAIRDEIAQALSVD